MRNRWLLPAGRRQEACRRHDRPDRAPRAGLQRNLGPRRRPGRRPAWVSGGCPSSICPAPPTSRLPRTASPSSTTASCTTTGHCGPSWPAGESGFAPSRIPRSSWRPGAAGVLTALKRFRGMFAFALADVATGELFLARDPFGIKPLYYLHRGDGVLFASELKALIAASGSQMRIEPGALVASMLYYWLPEERCAIDGVQQAARRLVGQVHPGRRLTVQQYWNIAEVAAQAADRAARRPAVGHRGRRSPRTWSPTSRSPASCPAAWTRASSRCSRTRPTPRSTPTRSPSGRKTSGSRRCPTTPSTRARSPRSTASTCTRSRSHRTS